MTRSQLAIVEAARPLADELSSADPSVKRNVWQSLVANFLLDRDVDRFQRLLDAVSQDQNLHARGKAYGDQLDQVVLVLSSLLKSKPQSPDELCSLFGWVGRLLEINARFGGKKTNPLPPTTPPKSKGGGLGAKNDATLAALRQRLGGAGS